jgi:hypothetical protein
MISDIGLSLISELPILEWESGVRHYIGYRNKVLSDIRHQNLNRQSQWLSVKVIAYQSKEYGFDSAGWNFFFLQCRILEWSLMSISEHFRYRNDVFQSNIFVSDIGLTDVDVGCRISPTLRSMSIPTYAHYRFSHVLRAKNIKSDKVPCELIAINSRSNNDLCLPLVRTIKCSNFSLECSSVMREGKKNHSVIAITL